MVARFTPDQKVTCSIHVEFITRHVHRLFGLEWWAAFKHNYVKRHMQS